MANNCITYFWTFFTPLKLQSSAFLYKHRYWHDRTGTDRWRTGKLRMGPFNIHPFYQRQMLRGGEVKLQCLNFFAIFLVFKNRGCGSSICQINCSILHSRSHCYWSERERKMLEISTRAIKPTSTNSKVCNTKIKVF